MSSTNLISLVTFLVTLILGFFSKKSKFIRNEMIPIQNILVGLVVAVIEWITEIEIIDLKLSLC